MNCLWGLGDVSIGKESESDERIFTEE